MDVRPVDPRDIEREVDRPAYRVHFWRQGPPGHGAQSWEYELTGAAGVDEVVAWADAQAGPDRTYVLYARVDRCLIRLAGEDPTLPDP